MVEMGADILQDKALCAVNAWMLRDMLRFNNVDVYTSSGVKEITKDHVVIGTPDGDRIIPAANVVAAAGYNPHQLNIDVEGVEVILRGRLHADRQPPHRRVWGVNDIVAKL